MARPLSKTRTFDDERFTRSIGGSGKRNITKPIAESHAKTAHDAGHKARIVNTKKHGYVVYIKKT